MLGKQGWNDSSKDGNSFGVNCFEGDVIDIYVHFIWEPTLLQDIILNVTTEFDVV